MKVIFVLMSLMLIGCKNQEQFKSTEAITIPGLVSYIGSDLNGEIRECSPVSLSPQRACTAEFGPGDEFAADCEQRGFEAVQCDCHDFICLDRNDELETGLDINGETKSCVPTTLDTICTAEFTAEDQFASDCRGSGKEVIQCGCHDYLCK